MTPEHIRKLLAEGEGLTIEYKECADGLNNNVWETVCSFSNRYGGHLILGVKDNGKPIGINRNAVQQLKKNFVNMLNNPQKMSPSLFLCLDEVELDDKLLLHAYIPVSSQIQSCSGRIYDRNEDGDFDITNSADLVAHLAVRKSSRFTEREIFPYAKEKHLLLDKLMPIVRNMAVTKNKGHPWKSMSDMEIIKSSGLYDEDVRTGKKGFNRAAILLFGRDEIIRQAAPGYVTDCILRVKDVDRYDDRLRVETNLIESFDAIMGFIAKHTSDPFFLIDKRNISVRDIISKEIVSNILVHREYSGTFPARIIIEKDCIRAENWNRALRHGRIDLNNFEPFPKNPLLARFFVNIGNADTLGSGIRNLVKYTKLYSGGEPEFNEGDIFRTVIPLSETKGEFTKTENVVVNVAEDVANNVVLKPVAAKIMWLLKRETNATANNIAYKLELNIRTVQRHLKSLKDLGIIERKGLKNVVVNVAENVAEDVAEYVALKPVASKIISLLKEDSEATSDEIAAKLSLNRRTVQRHLKSLKESGFIEREGSDRDGHWIVR